MRRMGAWQWVMVRRQTNTCLLLSLLALVAELNAELDFAVHVKEGGGEAAERIARKHGMKNMGEVKILICIFLATFATHMLTFFPLGAKTPNLFSSKCARLNLG